MTCRKLAADRDRGLTSRKDGGKEQNNNDNK